MAAATLRVGQVRERLIVAQIGALLVLFLVAAFIAWPRAEPLPVVGNLSAFPPGSITPITLETTIVDPAPTRSTNAPTPVYLWIINDPAKGLIAFYNRDPRSGCWIAWAKAEQRFIDPCYGSIYELTGEYVRGPSPRSMDQFGVVKTWSDQIAVDVQQFMPGAKH